MAQALKWSWFVFWLALFGLAACTPSSGSPAFTPAASVPTAPTLTLTPLPTNTRPVPTATLTALPTRPANVTAVPLTPTPTLETIGWDTRNLLVGPGEPGRLYVLQDYRGLPASTSRRVRLLMSDDFGDSWRAFPGGLPAEDSCLSNVDLDYAKRDALAASTCRGLYRWGDNKWNLISSQETLKVAIAYGQPNVIYATAPMDKGGPVITSQDGGKTWQGASQDLVTLNGLANIAIDPRDARTVYGIINPKYAGSYLRRMFVGSGWQTLPTPANNSQIDTGMTIDGASGDLYVTAHFSGGWELWRTHNPNAPDPDTIVWESVSQFGDKWATVLASGTIPHGLALFVKLSPGNCNSADPACAAYVQRSLDGGATWSRLQIK